MHFVSSTTARSAHECRAAVMQQRQRLANPEHTAEELLEIFYNQGLPMTVNKLKEVIDLL